MDCSECNCECHPERTVASGISVSLKVIPRTVIAKCQPTYLRKEEQCLFRISLANLSSQSW